MNKDLAVALDLGATNLRAAIVTKKGKILKSAKTKTPKTKSSKIITNTIIVLINYLLEEINKKRIKGIGIGSIGPIDFKKGEIINTSNLPTKKIKLKESLKNYFPFPIKIFNDCTAAVWGEKHFGAGKKVQNLFYITMSSGIGGGAIVNNHLLIGHTRNAAEIGHLIVDTKYNIMCSCKKGRGHWEAMCSGNNLPKFFKLWLERKGINKKYEIQQAKDIFMLADKKDKNVLNFLKEVGQINGHGFSNIIIAYNPELITIGGALALNNKKYIIPYLKKNIDHFIKLPEIKTTPLKEDVVLLGAAALVFYPIN
jgi:glucokinase